MCSEAGQSLIKDAIRDHRLTGVVICSCSPRMHEATFRKTAAAAGLNPYMVEIANIREQVSWIHKDVAEATEKAIILGRAAIAKGADARKLFAIPAREQIGRAKSVPVEEYAAAYAQMRTEMEQQIAEIAAMGGEL